jgi:hypothetical protein
MPAKYTDSRTLDPGYLLHIRKGCFMDADRFDALAQQLDSLRTRRGTISTVLAGALAALGLVLPDETWAKSGKCQPKCGECKKCKKGKCEKKDGKQRCKQGKCKAKPNDTPCTGGTCQGGTCVATPPPFCAGRNSCEDGNAPSTCQRAGSAQECVCVVTADTGAPFCALNNAGNGDNCLVNPCPEGQTCIDFAGGVCGTDTPGGTACAVPCPEPI